MSPLPAHEAQRNLLNLIDEVAQSHEPVVTSSRRSP